MASHYFIFERNSVSVIEFLPPSNSEYQANNQTHRSIENYRIPTAKLQLETFDSKLDERRDEKLVYKLIQRGNVNDLLAHLQNSKGRFDITSIYDRQGYTPLHFAAYKNQGSICKALCEFVLKENGPIQEEGEGVSTALNSARDRDQEELQQKLYNQNDCLKQWINCSSKGEEGFSALHFASFHGNIPLIRYLMSYGADPTLTNKQGINMLHVAAQGDQPASLYYFRQVGLDVDSRDKRRSTALHWAAFSGAELALSYLVAWNPDLNAQDSKGLTPLHLAVKSRRLDQFLFRMFNVKNSFQKVKLVSWNIIFLLFDYVIKFCPYLFLDVSYTSRQSKVLGVYSGVTFWNDYAALGFSLAQRSWVLQILLLLTLNTCWINWSQIVSVQNVKLSEHQEVDTVMSAINVSIDSIITAPGQITVWEEELSNDVQNMRREDQVEQSQTELLIQRIACVIITTLSISVYRKLLYSRFKNKSGWY